MSIKLEQLVANFNPSRTVLLLGAGASVPSGAPPVAKLIKHYSENFDLSGEYSLSEISSLAERKTSRSRIIKDLRKFFENLKPTGGIRNIPLYKWKSIFTTNYDDLVEQSYILHKKKIRSFSSNFDFTVDDADFDGLIFKIHGTIEKDVSDGNVSRIILTESDYEHTEDYREHIYDRFKGDIAGSDLLIIGQSLADPDMRAIVNRAATINSKIFMPAQIALLVYQPDEQRASLFEERGIKVAFGGIDDFFSSLALHGKKDLQEPTRSTDFIDSMPGLVAVTTEVPASVNSSNANIGAMFNGWPATLSDIEAGFTFDRLVSQRIVDYFADEPSLCAYLLGAAGVGKSTASRQALLKLKKIGVRAWEHNADHVLRANDWVKVAGSLRELREVGVLFIDDAHVHLHQVNDLIDGLAGDDNAHLKIILTSTRNHWNPRIKTPNLFKYGKEFKLSKLEFSEIEGLILLIGKSPDVAKLVENTFGGFNKSEQRRRLADRCEADMFVCLKNIFATDTFDHIILREYASLDGPLQGIYRYVAAMETAGVRVHRQLVIRLLGVAAQSVSTVLDNLSEIVHEYSVDERYGIYAWRCRHQVISSIVSKYKFKDLADVIKLFDLVIDNISPAYEIELMTLRSLCNIETGISRIPDKNIQNRLLRRMISIAPGERVPRHRLIRNLIDQGEYEKAETEIRLFGSDFGSDGPVHRYKIRLLISRAVHALGIMNEDRVAILMDAHELAVTGVARYQNNKSILSAFAELGIEYYRKTGKLDYFDEAISELKSAEQRIGDPDITSTIRQYERRLAGQPYELDGDVVSEA